MTSTTNIMTSTSILMSSTSIIMTYTSIIMSSTTNIMSSTTNIMTSTTIIITSTTIINLFLTREVLKQKEKERRYIYTNINFGIVIQVDENSRYLITRFLLLYYSYK